MATVRVPKIGDVVVSIPHGYYGMVFFTHPHLYAVQWTTDKELDSWFRQQKPTLHPTLKSKPWVEVLLMQVEQSVLLPASTVEVIVPFARIKKLLTEFAEHAKKKK